MRPRRALHSFVTLALFEPVEIVGAILCDRVC